MQVPFLDLQAQYQTIRADIDKVLQVVLDNCSFVRGPQVAIFERLFSQAHDNLPCVSVANGTDALFIVYKALGIGPGDEVITTACSWISTSETISLTGATPVFVDIEPNFFHLDPDLIEAAITSKTKAIVPVHLYGQPVDLVAIQQLCDQHNLAMIEDCAQAHLATYHGQTVGTFGVAATFSFYPGKNLGAYGDAGCIISTEQQLAQQCRRFANHGSLTKHDHAMEGINSRLDGMQAAILNAKLPYLPGWNKRRREIANYYLEELKSCGQIILPRLRPNTEHVFHVFCIRAQKRDELRQWLQERNIQTGLHYPVALPFLKAYERLGATKADFPVAHALQSEILSLPIYPEMSRVMADYVVSSIKEFYQTSS